MKELWCDFAIENGKFSEPIRQQVNFVFSVQEFLDTVTTVVAFGCSKR